MRSSGTTNVCDEKQYIIYNYHQPKTITGKSFQHFIHKQNLPPLLKVDYSFLHEISHTKAYTGLPTSRRNKMDATAHYSYVAKNWLVWQLTIPKDCWVGYTTYLLMEFKRLRMWSPHPVSCTDEAIHACSIKMGPGIITVYQTTLHTLYNMQQLSEGLPLLRLQCNCILMLDSVSSSLLTVHSLRTR